MDRVGWAMRLIDRMRGWAARARSAAAADIEVACVCASCFERVTPSSVTGAKIVYCPPSIPTCTRAPRSHKMSGGVRSKGNSGELDRANKTGHARHHMGWGVDLLGPPWNFKTDAMDNWQDNLLRTDPTTLHTWCQGFPCGATAQVQARAQGQPFKEDFTTGRRLHRERASTLREPARRVRAQKPRARGARVPRADHPGSQSAAAFCARLEPRPDDPCSCWRRLAPQCRGQREPQPQPPPRHALSTERRPADANHHATRAGRRGLEWEVCVCGSKCDECRSSAI